MKNPLRYQMSEYDCGPTSMLNAISYLFEREAGGFQSVSVREKCLSGTRKPDQ